MIKGIKIAVADLHYRVGNEYYFGQKRAIVGEIKEDSNPQINYRDYGFRVLDQNGDTIDHIIGYV